MPVIPLEHQTKKPYSSERGLVLPETCNLKPKTEDLTQKLYLLRVGVDGPIDHHDNLSHLSGEQSSQPAEEDSLGDDLNEVRFQERRFRQTGFSGLHLFTGRPFPSITGERNCENRIDPFGLVSRIDRDHNHSMLLVSEIDRPDFPAKRLGPHSL